MKADQNADCATPNASMTREQRLRWMEDRRQINDAALAIACRLDGLIGWTRVAIVAVTAAAIFALSSWLWAAGIAALTGAVAFAVVAYWHRRVVQRRAAAERLALALTESSQRCHSVESVRSPDRPARVSEMPQPILHDGPTWPLSDQERDDLDVYASPTGLFGLLNRTSTPLGANRLSDMLDRPMLSCERIKTRQQAVGWLAENAECRLRILAACVPFRGNHEDILKLLSAVNSASTLTTKPWVWLTRVWSIVCGASIVGLSGYAYLSSELWIGSYALLPLMANLLVTAIHSDRVTIALKPWHELERVVSSMESFARDAHDNLPDVTELATIKLALRRTRERPILPTLRRALAWMNIGGPLHVLANAAILYDWHVANAIHGCVVRGRTELLLGMAAIADLEALASLACFSWEEPATCWPEPTDVPILQVDHGRHPFIRPELAVPNDLVLSQQKRLWIITGPNASGKSTFLRMVGVSVLLAQVGSAVPASMMRWSPVCLMTDLQVRDDLAHGESYFLAEVRHLLRLVNGRGVPASVLGLIDEPFRGTNSHEKRAASMALVAYLLTQSNLSLIATHDSTLTQLAGDGTAAENVHFEESYVDGDIQFDYRLKHGVALTTTAIAILRQEDYPQRFLDFCREFLAE